MRGFTTQNATDNASLEPMVNEVEQRCGAPPGAALADSGFFSIDNLNRMEQRNIDAYVPDSNMACALNLGTRCRTRGLQNVNNELTLAALAFNLTRLHTMQAA